MILEHAVLSVKPGQEADFESAFAEAKSIISGMSGCEGLSLLLHERPGTYLLLVQWARLGNHTDGFRDSAQYQHWSRALHHFYKLSRQWSTTRRCRKLDAGKATAQPEVRLRDVQGLGP